MNQMLSIFAAGISDVKNNLTGEFSGQTTDLWAVVKNIINVAMIALGTLSVVMLVYAGIMYTTSAGDSAKVTKAKNTLLYGIIGLVIALLAVAIVNFVLDALLNQTN